MVDEVEHCCSFRRVLLPVGLRLTVVVGLGRGLVPAWTKWKGVLKQLALAPVRLAEVQPETRRSA